VGASSTRAVPTAFVPLVDSDQFTPGFSATLLARPMNSSSPMLCSTVPVASVRATRLCELTICS